MIKRYMLIIFAANVALWVAFFAVLAAMGFSWVLFVLALNSTFGVWMMATDPYYMISEDDAAMDSFINFTIYCVLGVVIMLFTAYRNLYEVVMIPDEFLKRYAKVINEEVEGI